jgi:hypothetical protein
MTKFWFKFDHVSSRRFSQILVTYMFTTAGVALCLPFVPSTLALGGFYYVWSKQLAPQLSRPHTVYVNEICHTYLTQYKGYKSKHFSYTPAKHLIRPLVEKALQDLNSNIDILNLYLEDTGYAQSDLDDQTTILKFNRQAQTHFNALIHAIDANEYGEIERLNLEIWKLEIHVYGNVSVYKKEDPNFKNDQNNQDNQDKPNSMF